MNRSSAMTLALTILLAGCAETSSPPSAVETQGDLPTSRGALPVGDPSEPKGTTATSVVEQVIPLKGTILVRPGTRPVSQGDPAIFYLDLPNGTASVKAVATWSPPQRMGLEFHIPETDDRITSWDEDPAKVHFQPPIEMTLDAPMAGAWWTYIGPDVIGGAVSWELTLTIALPEGAEATVRPDDPS